MQTWAEIVADVQTNWILYAAMPVVASLIGFATKIVAIRMMFEPLKFWGIPPYLGWQGIVPRKAAEMAAIACDTMTAKLIKPADIFDRIDPNDIARAIEQPLLAMVEEVTREVALEFSPGLWESLPDSGKRLLIRRVQQSAPDMVAAVMQDIKSDIDRVFDLKEMVITILLRDKRLLNKIFLEAGAGEFRFIRNSGLYFGFAIGVVQAITWAGTHSTWVMPLFGGFTGWFTDWIALKMVFRPLEPTRYLGLFMWQGLFLKRRKQVARTYGQLIAEEVLTARNILAFVQTGPLSGRVNALIGKHVERVMAEQAGILGPLMELSLGRERYDRLQRSIHQRIVARLPGVMRHAEPYATEAMDLKNVLGTKMSELTAYEFERLLRPAFEQDEWILIAVGAALGFLVGELQVFIMLHH